MIVFFLLSTFRLFFTTFVASMSGKPYTYMRNSRCSFFSSCFWSQQNHQQYQCYFKHGACISWHQIGDMNKTLSGCLKPAVSMSTLLLRSLSLYRLRRFLFGNLPFAARRLIKCRTLIIYGKVRQHTRISCGRKCTHVSHAFRSKRAKCSQKVTRPFQFQPLIQYALTSLSVHEPSLRQLVCLIADADRSQRSKSLQEDAHIYCEFCSIKNANGVNG